MTGSRTVSKKGQAKRDLADRAKAYWSARPAVERVQKHLERLNLPTTSRSERLVLWRLISSAALDAHGVELAQLESLKVPVADPSILPGGVVG